MKNFLSFHQCTCSFVHTGTDYVSGNSSFFFFTAAVLHILDYTFAIQGLEGKPLTLLFVLCTFFIHAFVTLLSAVYVLGETLTRKMFALWTRTLHKGKRLLILSPLLSYFTKLSQKLVPCIWRLDSPCFVLDC